MTQLEKPSGLAQQLQAFDIFASIPLQALQWLVDQSDYLYYPEGEYLFRSGEPIEHMSVILRGSYVIRREKDGRSRELGVWKAGYVVGMLPFSRMKSIMADGIALEEVLVLRLHKSCFTAMVNQSYELTQALVHVMTSRVRDYSQQALLDEKMLALGKLSAGLAHELNNPAAAIARSSEELYRRIHQTPERFKSVITMRVTEEQTDRINALLFSRIEAFPTIELSLLERESRLDDLVDWLEDKGIDNAEDIAETFVDFGFEEGDLDLLADILPAEALEPVTWWLESTLNLERLVSEIRESSSRISELVQSVKSYSYMDRETGRQPVDIHEGLKNTVVMLNHKFKQKQVRLHKEFSASLPPVEAYGGELNQVWTNIIVNALEVLPDQGGEIRLHTYPERQFVCIDITDNGPGIPAELQSRIFDPFFTTKSVGEGTGMGLDIVNRIIHRHEGEVTVSSRPGETTFHICLPAKLN